MTAPAAPQHLTAAQYIATALNGLDLSTLTELRKADDATSLMLGLLDDAAEALASADQDIVTVSHQLNADVARTLADLAKGYSHLSVHSLDRYTNALAARTVAVAQFTTIMGRVRHLMNNGHIPTPTPLV